MVGRLVDAAGEPVAGVVIRSVEAESKTDEAGQFAVSWKVPDTQVIFNHTGINYQRALQLNDPAEVTIQMPVMRTAELVCPPSACLARLSWALDDGLSAMVLQSCEPGARHPLQAAPVGTPQVACRVKSAETALAVEDSGDRLVLLGPAEPLRVEVHSVEGRLPERCDVRIAHRDAVAAGDGFWTGTARAGDVVRVVCADRAAWPVRVPGDVGTVSVEWSRVGPTVDLEGLLPDAATLRIAPEGEAHELAIGAGGDGLFALPPLSVGRYRVRVDGPDTSDGISWPDPGRAGALVLHAQGEALVGVLQVDRDTQSGRLPVTGP